MKIGFIGAGNMGMALIKGVASSEMTSPENIFVYDIDTSKRETVEELSLNFCSEMSDITKSCSYIVLAVKPQQLGAMLEEHKDAFTNDMVLISICAGISIDFIRDKLNRKVKVVLAMPNTPMMLGLGASAMATDELTTKEELHYARQIIGSCGITEVIPLSQMNDIIPINGSAPAFFYLFAQGFMEYAAERGIELYSAQKLLAHTMTGAAKMITSSGYTMEELIAQVSSKGGTTIAGLEKLKEANLVDAVKKACTACSQRAVELGKENS